MRIAFEVFFKIFSIPEHIPEQYQALAMIAFKMRKKWNFVS